MSTSSDDPDIMRNTRQDRQPTKPRGVGKKNENKRIETLEMKIHVLKLKVKALEAQN